jgi:hypothetical protein
MKLKSNNINNIPVWHALYISGFDNFMPWDAQYLFSLDMELYQHMILFFNLIGYVIAKGSINCWFPKIIRGRRGRDRLVVGFINIYAIGAYHH